MNVSKDCESEDTFERGFISDENLIAENHEVSDLFGFEDYVNNFSDFLGSIKKPSMVGLVGKFGSGKSTMLYQLKNSNEEDLWIEFNAWKYPDRKDLWEGFVMDFADQIGNKNGQR